MQITVAETIAAPPEQVFDAMADARNEATWNSQVSSTTLDSGEPIGLGTTFTSVNRGQTYRAEITEYDRPSRLAFTVTGKTMAITGRIGFAPDGAGTRMTGEFDMRPQGYMKVLLPLMAPMVRKDFPKQIGSFKQMVEGGQ